MKQKLLWMMVAAFAFLPMAQAQDAAVEEKISRMNGYIEGLQEENASLKKQIANLSREIQALREQANQPNTAYASHEDLKRLADQLKEVDKKRVEDNERIAKQIDNLGKTLSRNPTRAPRNNPSSGETSSNGAGASASGKGYNHKVASGDTLSTIAQEYSKATGSKITVEQILKANPDLVPEKLKVGQEIFIPKP